jgi:phosphoribosylamine-glycine ligase
MDNGSEQERKWKIATILGEGGREIHIYAYGRTLEEAKKRAGTAEARVQISMAEQVEEDAPDKDKA